MALYLVVYQVHLALSSDEFTPSILGLVVPEKSTGAIFMICFWYPMRILRLLISLIQVLSIIEGRCSTRLFLRSNSSQHTLSKPHRFAEKLMQEKYIGKYSLHIECLKDLVNGRTSRFVNLTPASWMRVALSYLQRNCHQLSPS